MKKKTKLKYYFENEYYCKTMVHISKQKEVEFLKSDKTWNNVGDIQWKMKETGKQSNGIVYNNYHVNYIIH